MEQQQTQLMHNKSKQQQQDRYESFRLDKDTDEFAQFSIAMPKSWNEGTLTYQVYWTPGSTNTGDCIFGLQAVACADNDTIDVAYGTAVNVTDAGIGAVEDQQISSESGAVTVAGSPAAGVNVLPII